METQNKNNQRVENSTFGIFDYFIDSITSSWWQVLLMGILGLIFGIATVIWPNITILVLAIIIAIFAIKIFSVINSGRGPRLMF